MSASMSDLEKTEKSESTPLRSDEHEEINLKSPQEETRCFTDIDLKERDPNNINEHVRVSARYCMQLHLHFYFFLITTRNRFFFNAIFFMSTK